MKTRIVIAILVVILLVLGVGPFLVPIPPLTDTRPPEALGDPDSQFVQVNGIRVHLKTAGQDQPVIVLLHGFGASLYSWHAVMQPLSQAGAVIAYDRPGFGLTERPMEWDGPNPYSPESQAALLEAVLDHFGVREAVLVGNSAGGTLALQFARLHPERVQALVLVDAAVYNSGGAPGWVRPLLSLPQVHRLGPLFVRQIRTRGLQLLDMAWHDPSRIPPEAMDLYQKPLQADNWDRALWEFSLVNPGESPAGWLDELDVPSLVITGDDDRIVPTADSLRLAEELPGAQLVVIPSAGHVPHEEQPAAFLEAVNAFLASLNP